MGSKTARVVLSKRPLVSMALKFPETTRAIWENEVFGRQLVASKTASQSSTSNRQMAMESPKRRARWISFSRQSKKASRFQQAGVVIQAAGSGQVLVGPDQFSRENG